MPITSSRLFTRPTLLALAAAACVSATAQENTQTMSEVVVTASGFEQELKQAPASISVVTREELERKSFRDVAEALHGVEGIDVRSGQGKTGGLNISMRGMPSSFTLILVDGRRTNPAGEITPNGFGDSNNVMIPPVSAIERIEIVRGPMSTLYGSDAMGGVVNIITRKVAKEWTGSASVEGSLPQTRGEGATQKTNFYLSGPIKTDVLGISIRGGLTHRDGHDRAAFGVTSDTSGNTPSKSDVYSLGAKLSLTPKQGQQFWLDVETQRSKYDNRRSDMGNLDTPTNARGYGPELHFNRDAVAIGYEEKTQLGLLSASLSHRTNETLGRTIPSNAAQPPAFPAGSARILDSNSTYLDTKIVSPLGDASILSTGLQLGHEEARDGLSIKEGTPKFTQKTWAVFTENEWFIVPSLALTTGIRYDHHDKFGGNFSPRGYAVWNANSNWIIKGGVSRGFRAPRMNQLVEGVSGYSGQGTVKGVGNPALQPETSTSTEIAALYDDLQGWTSGITLFHNKIKNKIESADCTATNTPLPGCIDPAVDTSTYNYNADSGKTYGAELSSKWRLQHGLEVKTSYTWTESQLVKNGIKSGRFSDTAKHLFLANVNWKINQQWSTWAQGEYRSGARRYSDAARQNEFFKPYSLFHIGVNYALTKQVSMGVSVHNVFDRNFRAGTAAGGNYYATGGAAAKGSRQDGRTIWLRTSVQF